jgi:hypothetical protein
MRKLVYNNRLSNRALHYHKHCAIQYSQVVRPKSSLLARCQYLASHTPIDASRLSSPPISISGELLQPLLSSSCFATSATPVFRLERVEPKNTVCTLSFVVHRDLQDTAANSKAPSLLRMGIEEGLSHRQSTHPKGLAIVLAVAKAISSRL